MTLTLVAYAGLIFIGIALAIYHVRRQQKRRAIIWAIVVAALTVAGLIAAIASSVV